MKKNWCKNLLGAKVNPPAITIALHKEKSFLVILLYLSFFNRYDRGGYTV